MKHYTKKKLCDLLLLVWFLLPTIPGCAIRKQIHLKELEHIREISEVSGRYIGVAGIEGEFYTYSLKLIKKGDKVFLLSLLEDENPVARAMGLVCLVQLDFQGNQQILKKYYSDQGVIEFIPYGCAYSTITIGQFARLLSQSPSLMGYSKCR